MIFLILLQSLFAQTVTENDLKTLQQKLGTLASLSSDFEQERYFASRPTRPVLSSGKAYFAKPGKFRWDLNPKKTQKTNEILLYDGNFLYQLSENKGPKFPAHSSRAKELLRIADLVLDFSVLTKDYKITRSARQKEFMELDLVPKITSNEIELITVKIDQTSGFIKYLKMLFTNKNSSTFNFSNVQINNVLPDKFNLPAGSTIFNGL